MMQLTLNSWFTFAAIGRNFGAYGIPIELSMRERCRTKKTVNVSSGGCSDLPQVPVQPTTLSHHIIVGTHPHQ